MLASALAATPEQEALVTANGRWTYAELDRECAAAAGALDRLGVRAGDRVAACLPNDLAVVAAFHGVLRRGALWVGVNRALAPPEKSFILSDSGATLLLGDAAAVDEVRRGEHGARLVDIGETEWAGLISDARSAAAPAGDSSRPGTSVPIDPHAPAAIAYTSGTTGHPKGVVHSQHNLLAPGAAVVALRGWDHTLRKGDCLPLTILNMLVLTTLLVAQAGGTCIVMDQVEAVSVAGWIERERVTVWNGVPALLHTMVNSEAVRPEALASLEELWVGGADCPDALRAAVAAKFGLPVTHTYGLTEAPTIVTIDPAPGPDGADPHRRGASGVALPHLAVRILDEKGDVVPAGESGEICLAPAGLPSSDDGLGPYVPPLGYWDRPEATEALLVGGVMHTGDIGYLDEDGYLYIRDRKNLMILRGGANVYPAEVERVLSAIPGVEAVAVFGVEDERLGQRVAAAVQLRPGAALTDEDLVRACSTELARYKVPERWVFVEGFTRNSMGKIDRPALNRLLPLP